jgi:hypothetical protein
MQTWQNVLVIVLGVVLGLAVAAFLMRKTLGPRIGQMMGKAYQQRFMKQLKKQYPLLSERFAEYEMGPERQEAFQNAMKKLPPQEAMKLQAEFNRLRENFMGRHPELNELITGAQDARGQMKAMDQVMKLPADKRQAIEKDLLWAWDQLRGRFPKLMGPLEAAFRRKAG